MQKLLRHILLLGITAFLFLSGWSLVGCAYYNYLYDAKRSGRNRIVAHPGQETKKA